MSEETHDPADGATPSHPSNEATPTYDYPGRPGLPPDLSTLFDPPQADDELGRLGGYRVLRALGHGGMGVVFEAEEVALARRVALKLMRPQFALCDDARRRFVREAQTAAATEHDHIVPIFGVGEVHGVPFLAMPLLPGESLAARLERERILPIADLVQVGRDVASGLSAAHTAGLVHRDIKPANLWLEGPGAGKPFRRVRVLDFGLARSQTPDGLSSTGELLGTPAYMSPEQVDGRPLDGRSDLFALGCVLYRAATGRPPFDGPTVTAVLRSVADHRPPAPKKLRPDLPGELSDLILRLLEKSPERRPVSAAAVGDALRTVSDTAARPARWPVAWVAGVVVALTLGAVVIVSLLEQQRAGETDRGGGTNPPAPVATKPPPPRGLTFDDVLSVQVDCLATEVAANLKDYPEPVDAVAVGDAIHPIPGEVLDGSTVSRLLADSLVKRKLKLDPSAAIRIVVEREDVLDMESIQLAVRLAATSTHRNGKRLFECCSERTFAGNLSLPDVLDGLAKEFALNLTSLPTAVATVAVGDFTGPIAQATTGGGGGLAAMLIESLRRHGVKVAYRADIGIKGEYGYTNDATTGRPVIFISAACKAKGGRTLFEVQQRCALE